MLRAFLFDCDGVLADNESAHYVAFSTALLSRGVVMQRARYDGLSGLPDGDVIAAALEASGKTFDAEAREAILAAKRASYARSLKAGLVPVPGVASFLREASGHYALAVVSGAFRDEVDSIIDRLEVADLLPVRVTVEDCTVGKPDPAPFLTALERLNDGLEGDPIAPGECLVFEDSPHGIAAARAAGMRSVGITTSQTGDTLRDADLVAPHFRALDLSRLTAFFDRRAR